MFLASGTFSVAVVVALLLPASASEDGPGNGAQRHNEYLIMEDHKIRDNYYSPLPFTYIDADELPASFNWGDVDGVSYLTRSLNQHLPYYCGR